MIDKEKVIANLKEVYDPEMPSINIYDLGLIYDIKIEGTTLTIKHTLTSPMCPFADYIVEMVQKAGYADTGAEKVEIDLTFTPPFTMDMVPEETKLIMGWL